MTDRIITADATKVSPAEFFAAVTGRPLLTKGQREAEWRAKCGRAADAIENGLEALVPPPLLRDARQIVEQRALTRKVESELSFTVAQQRARAAA